jgi:DNA polymerase/3'-5' exonuclease PolX
MNKLDDFEKLDIINKENKYIVNELIRYYNYIYNNYSTSNKTTKENFYKLAALKKTILIIAKFKKKLLSGEELEDIKGIGPKTIGRINEIIKTGSLSEIEKEDVIKSELSDIYGIGPVKASYYYDKYKITKLDDFVNRIKKGEIKITKQIELGLKYRNKLINKIPRVLIARLENWIQQRLYSADKNFVSVICGSYRREKDFSSDIDILITHKELKDVNKTKVYLEKAVKSLNFLVDNLTENFTSHYQGFASFSKISEFSELPKIDFNIGSIIRVDIIIVPTDSFFTALLHFTGSGEFNQKLRIHAKNLDMKLSEYGLFKYANKKYVSIKIESEEDIFKNLLLKYLPPNKR